MGAVGYIAAIVPEKHTHGVAGRRHSGWVSCLLFSFAVLAAGTRAHKNVQCCTESCASRERGETSVWLLA
jgi:hypothetical protein